MSIEYRKSIRVYFTHKLGIVIRSYLLSLTEVGPRHDQCTPYPTVSL